MHAPHPTGDPPGRPYIARRLGSLGGVKRTERWRLFPTKQQRDASPCQGEAGAQRRVRVDPAVHVGATRCVALVRSCTTAPHHPGCPPVTAPAGDPPGRPYIARRSGAGSCEPRAFPCGVGAWRCRAQKPRPRAPTTRPADPGAGQNREGKIPRTFTLDKGSALCGTRHTVFRLTVVACARKNVAHNRKGRSRTRGGNQT